MSECEGRFEEISALIDGELSGTAAEALLAHIARCPDCAAAYEALSGLGQALEEEVPAGLHERIMRGVDEARRVQRAQRRFTVLRPVLAATACLVVVVGTVFFTGNLIQNKSARSSAASAGGAKGAQYTVPAVPFAAATADSAASAAGAANGGEAFASAGGAAADPSEEAPAAAEPPMAEPGTAAVSGAGTDLPANAPAEVTTESADGAAVSLTARVEEVLPDGTLRVTVTDAGTGALEVGEQYRIAGDEETDAGAVGPGTLVRLTLPVPQPPRSGADADVLQADSIEIVGE